MTNLISVHQILGRQDKFFDLLELSAEEARSSVRALNKYLQDPFQFKTVDELMASRRRQKELATKISDELCTTFVTALEREEIEALSVAIYKIPKTVEKIAERIMIAPQFLKSINLSRQMALMLQAGDTLWLMMKELRKGLRVEHIKALNDQMQAIEGEADAALLKMLGEMYATPNSVVRAVFLKDILELQEKVFDRCRDAGNIITQIVLKNT